MTYALYKDHPIHDQVDQMLEILNQPQFQDENIFSNESYAFARQKLDALLVLLKTKLLETPAELANLDELTTINSYLQSATSDLTAFIGNKSPGHLINAVNQIQSNVLSKIWALPPSSETEAIKVFPEILKNQSETSEKVIQQLKQSADHLQSELTASADRANQLEARLVEMQESAARERAEASAAIAKLHQEFTEHETDRTSRFEKAQKAFYSQFEIDHQARLDEANTKLASLNRVHEDAKQILQIIGNIGVTGNYQKIAASEEKQANFWRWATVGIFGVGIVTAIITFGIFLFQPLTATTLWSVAIRLLYAIAITAPAWYTARESARHRSNADRARQTELELASLGPFIELMPEGKKIEIKTALTTSYFGKSVPDHQVQTPVDSMPIKEALEVIASALKK